MNVRQLRALINDMPDDTRVFIRGYESGLEDLTKITPVTVALDANDDHYGGPHYEFDADDSYDRKVYGHATRVQGIKLT